MATTDNVYPVLQRILDNNPYLVGSGIGFVNNFYSQHGKWYEPYVARQKDGSYEHKNIGSAQHDYHRSEWFVNALSSDSGYWSEPYYDEAGAQVRLCTFAYPLRNKEGKVVGVLGIDLALDWLSDLINVNHVYPSSYNMMISSTGQLLACPTESLVMRSTIQEATKKIEDTTAQYINTQMMSGNTGSASLIADDGKKYHVYYAPMDHGWSMAVVCSDKEIYQGLNRASIFLFLLMVAGLLLMGLVMARLARNYRRLRLVTQEKERIGNELRIASGIQMGMLPKIFPPYPDRDDVEIFGSLVPAKEVGGDLYDFHIRDEKLFFCIGDVSGKGVPASLVMAVTRSLFRTLIAHEAMPDRIVTNMNDAMAEMNEENMFVTFFVGVLDLPTGRMRYCNAGHCPPLIIGEKQTLLKVDSNIPLGLMMGWKYTCQEVMLPPETTIFLYTDGLTEAENEYHDQFGEQRMLDVAKTLERGKNDAMNGAEVVIKRMEKAVHEFVDGAEPSDDLTMLSVEYTRKQNTIFMHRTLRLVNDINDVPKLNAFVDDVCEAVGFDASTTMQMNLAMEEAVVNVMNYAYASGVQGDIDIEAAISSERLKFIIIDSGMAFDPTAKAEVDTSLGIDDRPIGGLGIHLVRQLMDSINYERIDGKNVLTLRKRLK